MAPRIIRVAQQKNSIHIYFKIIYMSLQRISELAVDIANYLQSWWIVTLIILPYTLTATADENLWSRNTLTGDWGEIREQLANNGINFKLEATEFYQGLLKGSGNQDFAFSSKGDALINFDSTKLGLWPGGGLHTHLEYRGGDASGFRGGALWPANTATVLPFQHKDELVASSIYLSQRIGDTTNLMLGKINVLDLLAGDPFFGGLGIHRFMNLAFVAPPSGVLPPVIIGGIASFRFAPYSFSLMVYDPEDHTGDYSLHRLFDSGINVSLSGGWMGKLAERSSSLVLTGTYSTKDGADLSQEPTESALRTKEKDGSHSISLQASHLIIESPILPGKGLGIYAKAAIADGNPNMIRAAFIGGLAGYGMIRSRPRDYFGVGYFYYNFSNDLEDVLRPEIEFADEKGIELFYNIAVTNWLRVTADMQFIDPAIGSKDQAVVGGLRMNLVF